jgi:hypothetical protein
MKTVKVIAIAIVVLWMAWITLEIYWIRVEAQGACSYSSELRERARNPNFPKDVILGCR